MVKEIFTKRSMLLITFITLAIMKMLGLNGTTDDMMLIILGAIAGKEVLEDAKK